MAILDPVTPRYYEPLNMGIQQPDGGIVVIYDVAIRNVNGDRMRVLHPGSTATPEERAAIAVIYRRDKAQFEAATGLEEWIPPE